MNYFRQYIHNISPAAQKLACLYAYIGGHLSDEDKTQLAVHGACMMGELPLLTASLIEDGIVAHLPATHFAPEQQMIRARYYADVMLFAIEEHLDWIHEFQKWPLTRNPKYDDLQKVVRMCAAGKMPPPIMLDTNMPPYLVGLANDRRFDSLLLMIRDVDFPAFIMACIKKWMKDDFKDNDEILQKHLSMRKLDDSDPDIKMMFSLVNYYNFVCRGTYNNPSGIRMNYYDLLTKAVHAIIGGKADLAVKLFSDALSSTKTGGDRFITDGIAAIYWVIATWLSKGDNNRAALMQFKELAQASNPRRVGTAILLADMLLHPLQRLNMDMLADLLNPQTLADREYILQQKLAAVIGAQLGGMPYAKENEPQTAFLRHEALRFIKTTKYEKRLLDNVFGSKPMLGMVQVKAPWELVVERLLASESQRMEPSDEGERRVMYVIQADGESVELREQNRLRSGKWGLGKVMPLSRFSGGNESFMDRTDQAVLADLRFTQSTRLTVGIILPHLVGSDRVFTSEYTPNRRVNIESQPPYIMVEHTEEGFHLQSNVQFQELLSPTSVFHRDDAMHYVYFPMKDHERSVLQELLSVTDFPAAAEPQLRKLLPMLRNVIEIHSDLIPDERELPVVQGQTSILIRLTPDPVTQTLFDADVMVRPLAGGHMTTTPGQGDKVIIDENEDGRFRVERQFEGETQSLAILLDYCNIHGIKLNGNLNGHLPTLQVLDLLAFVSSHMEMSTVEWPEGERLKMRSTMGAQWNISLKNRGRWFEIEGNVRLDDNEVLTAQQLLQAISGSHGGYVQLQNGDYLWLSEKLRQQLDTLESITTQTDGHATIPTLHTSILAQLLHGEIDIDHDTELNNMKERIEAADKMEVPVPKTLNATLRPYQKDGYEWLMRLSQWGAGACLADDMGLGKTIQTIAYLLQMADQGPSLVVAPASVVSNWKNEIERFAPTLTAYNMSEYYDRRPLVEQAEARDVLICTYGLLVSQAGLINARSWNVVCLDEAHNIKNRGTKTSAACMEIQATHRLILTGTPVQNHLGELWNLFQFINPGLLGTYEQFSQKYIIPIENMEERNRQNQLQALVAPFMLRRTKQAVVKELPDKTEINLTVELTPQEMALYEVIRREAEQKFKEEGEQLSVNALAEITRLRRTACSAELTDPTWTGGSSKVNAFKELVQDIVDGGHNVLVFSQFTGFLALIQKALEEIGLPYFYLDGSVPIKQREQLVADFQKGKRPIFLISLKAGGVGLNLTAANYVIHLDPWWNPAIEQQATDRAYRIGQTQAVTVYHLISHHTIEEKILRLHESKRAISESILEGADKNHRLTAKDMLDMLSNQW